MSENHLPAIFALLAAVLFGLGTQLTRLGLRTIDSQSGALLTIGSSTLLYWAAAPWYLQASFWSSRMVWLFILIGLFRPVLSSNLSIAGTALLGPTISSTLASTAPLFGLLFGVLLLGEQLTVPVAGGTAAIVAGVVLLAQRHSGDLRVSWPLWALLLPVGAAFIRIAAQWLAKVGMEELPSPYFVGLVGYSASLAVALGNNARRRVRLRTLFGSVDSTWFLLAGVLFGAAIQSLNFALQHGRLSVVAPIASSEPLFVLLLGLLCFGERTINRRVAAAVLLVVIGVITISARG